MQTFGKLLGYKLGNYCFRLFFFWKPILLEGHAFGGCGAFGGWMGMISVCARLNNSSRFKTEPHEKSVLTV